MTPCPMQHWDKLGASRLRDLIPVEITQSLSGDGDSATPMRGYQVGSGNLHVCVLEAAEHLAPQPGGLQTTASGHTLSFVLQVPLQLLLLSPLDVDTPSCIS